MKRTLRWVVIAGTAATGIAAITVFGWMAANTAGAKTGGWIAAAALLAVGLAGAVSYYVLASRDGSSPRRPFWTTARGLATLVSAVLAGLAAMSLLFPLMDPPVATRQDVQDEGKTTRTAVEEARDTILDALPPPQRAVVDALPGLWGEAGCAVVYDFRVSDGGLVIERVRKSADMPDYAMTAAIVTGGEGGQLHAVIVRSSDAGEKEGQALIFTHERAAGEERLNWRNLTHQGYGGTKLERCR